MIQRLLADKLGITSSEPLPKSFTVLNNSAALEKSWTNYLAHSALYLAKVKEWEQKKKTDPKLKEPKPSDIAGELVKIY